jgi:8-oxo-dGTP diphosphatase
MNTQQNMPDERFFCPCPAGRHWGPRGAAGILPYAVARDGGVWVLLSHRSPHVQRGGTWSTFGGAIDVDESAWQAAVRETCEEIRGITPDQAGIAGQCVWQCPQGCGWTYTTFAVRVPLHPGGSLPRARVASGRAAWETAGLAWVPVSQVQGAGRDLHPSFADTWPALRQAISHPRSARSPHS